METNIKVEGLTLSMMQTNCYIVSNRDTKECVVIDPASSAEHIRDTINRNGYTLKAILLTHGHFDHIGGAKRLKSFFDVPILAAEAEKPVLLNTAVNLSDEFGGDCSLEADMYLQDGEEIAPAGFQIKTILTPGHTCGGMCYYVPEESVLFCGDTLFLESVGRTDFPTGNMSELVRSVETKLFVLPEDTVVYPGHGSYTSIGFEKQNNPYF